MTCDLCNRTAPDDVRPCYCHWMRERRTGNGSAVATMQQVERQEPTPEQQAETVERAAVRWLAGLIL